MVRAVVRRLLLVKRQRDSSEISSGISDDDENAMKGALSSNLKRSPEVPDDGVPAEAKSGSTQEGAD